VNKIDSRKLNDGMICKQTNEEKKLEIRANKIKKKTKEDVCKTKEGDWSKTKEDLCSPKSSLMVCLPVSISLIVAVKFTCLNNGLFAGEGNTLIKQCTCSIEILHAFTSWRKDDPVYQIDFQKKSTKSHPKQTKKQLTGMVSISFSSNCAIVKVSSTVARL